MLIVLLAVADESEDRTLDESASTSDKDEEPFFPRRREKARLNELRSCTRTHVSHYQTPHSAISTVEFFHLPSLSGPCSHVNYLGHLKTIELNCNCMSATIW